MSGELDLLLEAEAQLDGEELIAAQVAYLRAGTGWFPGAFHDPDECTVCDARREAIRRYDAGSARDGGEQ